MTNLDCSVTGCVYNADRCCCKGDIVVAGKEATENSGTCCSSFKERGENQQGRNAVGERSKEIDVTCEACHCRFNKDRKCAAEHIGIAGGNACTCGETECASFECNCR